MQETSLEHARRLIDEARRLADYALDADAHAPVSTDGPTIGHLINALDRMISVSKALAETVEALADAG